MATTNPMVVVLRGSPEYQEFLQKFRNIVNKRRAKAGLPVFRSVNHLVYFVIAQAASDCGLCSPPNAAKGGVGRLTSPHKETKP